MRIKRRRKQHIDGLEVVKYEQLVNSDDVETARSTVRSQAEEKVRRAFHIWEMRYKRRTDACIFM